jgi:hypothetical protein
MLVKVPVQKIILIPNLIMRFTISDAWLLPPPEQKILNY